LRTPLSIAQGYLELLLEGLVGELNEDQFRLLQISNQSLKRMGELIDKITDLTRLSLKKGSMNLEELDLSHQFMEVHQDLAYFMKIRDLELVNELGEQPATVLAVRDMLSQVFSNLLKNAICFTPDGGKITVRTHTDGRRAYFQIEDTGIGIEAEHLATIFDEFYQVHDVTHHKSGNFEFMTRGIGVGLPLCQGILNELGGKIWAESPGLDKGSTFTFYLPMVNQE
jgi:signal transduction histidine kinase